MAKQTRILLISISSVIVVTGILLFCIIPFLLENDKTSEVLNEEKYYTINPQTIINSLSQGKNDVFALQSPTPPASLGLKGNRVLWKQVDFFRILGSLNSYAGYESLDSWKFERMLFKLNCADINYGPQYAAIKYFKITSFGGREARLGKDFWIDPLNDAVSVHTTELVPNVLSYETFDLPTLKVFAEDALLIAEKNGGLQARLSLENNCIIYLSLAPGAIYGGWQVSYSGNSLNDIFGINIDPVTGKFQVLSNSK